MIPDHRNAFWETADEKNCWIGLREPNRLAERWIGKDGYVPKSMECKATTADNPLHRFGGLVADPFDCTDAFLDETIASARKKWMEFMINERFRTIFNVVKDGSDRGLLRSFDKCIYSDYDLMAILRATTDGRMTYTQTQIEGPSADGSLDRMMIDPKEKSFADEVIRAINRRIGIDMIQHGTEFMYLGVGAKAKEEVYWYGPKRQFIQSESSMAYSKDKNARKNIMH
jgi:hypothetical protein